MLKCKKNPLHKIISNLRLNRKIQFTYFVIIIPLFIIFIVLSVSIFGANQKYYKVITNATEASRFSITFKEDFDYDVYVLVAYGESEEIIHDIQNKIAEGRDITNDLINNTNVEDNKWRAERMLQLLDNLEGYVETIRENKRIGGFYDENYGIWENDIQIVTTLLQTNVLEYSYFETKGMNEIRADINKELNSTLIISLIVFGLLTVVALVLSVILPNSIVKPIYHLNDITNEVAKGDFSVRSKELDGLEIKKLGHSLNSMIEKINHLMEAVKIDERYIREAELELLQSQINPHFLYNTLDTIVWLAESGKHNKVVDMVTSLSEFFRASLSEGNGIITLEEEIKHVRSYLEIQYVRYQDILSYHIDFDPAFACVKIPKITLQPLVENALYHGIKNRRGKGEIKIIIMQEGSDVIISVKDNGIGMKPEVLDRVTNNMHRKKNKKDNSTKMSDDYALFNVNERIRMKFGEAYGLTICSTYNIGTIVQVRIPNQQI